MGFFEDRLEDMVRRGIGYPGAKEFGKLWGYLCVFRGMGVEGGPIDSLGGWGRWARTAITCNSPTISATNISDDALVHRHNRETYMVMKAVRKWIRTHGVYTTTITLPSQTTVHKSWTKTDALEWMWLHSRKRVAQQLSIITNVFGQRIAVRYYR